MKKLKILNYLIFTLLLLFFSCKKNDSKSEIADVAAQGQLYNSVMNLSTVESRGLGFSGLAAKEKTVFVLQRLDQVAVDLKLNQKQLEILNDIKRFAKEEVYDKGEFYQKLLAYEPIWRAHARQYFTKDQLRYAFGSFESFEEYKKNLEVQSINQKNVSTSSIKDCNCSDSSDYCSGASSCPKSDKSCSIVQMYCGTLFLYDCNSMCAANTTT